MSSVPPRDHRPRKCLHRRTYCSRSVELEKMTVVAVSAGEHPVPVEDWKSRQDNRLRTRARTQAWRRHQGVVWNSRIHGSRGRSVRTNTLRYGHVEHRRHRLRTVRFTVIYVVDLDRHRPPITAIGWCLDVCHTKNTNVSRRQEFFPSLNRVSGTLCLSHYVTETSHLHSLRDFRRHFGLCRAATHSECCFFAPCTKFLLTYLLTYLLQESPIPDQ